MEDRPSDSTDLGTTPDKKTKALTLLKSYGPSVIDAVGSVFPGGPVAAGLAKKAASTGLDKFLKQPSLLEQRAKLQELLGDAEQRLAICVEDIDRLTPAEALRVAILVRHVGAFPNVVYLVPYDRPHFEQLLSIALDDKPNSTEMGRGFRERLVQLEIPLPRASAIELQRMLDMELNRAIAAANLPDKGPALDEAFRRFGELWLFGVKDLFLTPRARGARDMPCRSEAEPR